MSALIVVLICISLRTNAVEHLLIVLIRHLIIFAENFIFKFFAHF